MRKVKVKIPAKVNLTLDVVGVKDGFHQIKSLVSSVSVYDTLILKRRKDFNVTLSVKGLDVGVEQNKNNAYLTAKKFMEKFSTYGVDIKLVKRIPIGGGMGGSSADIVGVLLAMKELYQINADLSSLANELGSDTGYMLNGGTKIISGKGEIVEDTAINTPLYFTALKCDKNISAKQCYSIFDSLDRAFEPCTEKAAWSLENKDFMSFCSVAKNDLYYATAKEIELIDKNLSILKEVGAPLVLMTGSGTVTMGVYQDKKIRDKHHKLLKKKHGKNLLKFDTVSI